MSGINNVVVVGAGCAGITIASKLEASLPANYRVILIEKRGFFYHTIGALRASVEELDITFQYDKLFKKTGTFVQAEVVGITDGSVKIEPAHPELGDTIPYSYLVLATGSTWCSAFLNAHRDIAEAKNILSSMRANISNAANILIVGGGAAGIELAGEIKEHYPTKKVTIIHGLPHLFNDRYPVKYRKTAQLAAEKRGIEFILDDKLEPLAEFPEGGHVPVLNARTYTTQKGKEINADLLVFAIGARPNVGLMNNFDASLVTPLGIKVKNTCQLDHATLNNIFVAGDAAGFTDCKGAYKAAHLHGPVVIHNILTLIKGKNNLKTYEALPSEKTILCTLGKQGGTSLVFNFNVGDFTTRTIKSKKLFIENRQKELGY